MTDSLAIVKKTEDVQLVAQPLIADLPMYVDACVEMDGGVLGAYIEQNWDPIIGTALGMMHLVEEMKRKFKLLDRKKQVNGEYRTIRGFRSFKKWFSSFTGKSERLAYYLLETEEKKNERNAGRRSTDADKSPRAVVLKEEMLIGIGGKKFKVLAAPEHDADMVKTKTPGHYRMSMLITSVEEVEKKGWQPTPKKESLDSGFLARCADAKKKLAEIQRQKDVLFSSKEEYDAAYKQTDTTIGELFNEFQALISPDGYEVMKGDIGWHLNEKPTDEEMAEWEEKRKARRSAGAKKAAATRAKNQAICKHEDCGKRVDRFAMYCTKHLKQFENFG
jgi:hypothetical protein